MSVLAKLAMARVLVLSPLTTAPSFVHSYDAADPLQVSTTGSPTMTVAGELLMLGLAGAAGERKGEPSI